MEAVPFEHKTLHLKQVQSTALDDTERAALAFFFPGYHEGTGFHAAEPQPNSPLKQMADRGFAVVEDKNQHRRYAGDFSLPRSSYFTVCRNVTGDDGGLLLRELQAYSKPQHYGHVEFYDTTAPDEQLAPLRAMLRPGKSALFCMPHELNHFPNPFRKLVDPQGTRPDAQICAIVPTRLDSITFDRLIDLRVPQTRQWFVTELTRLVNRTEPRLPVFPLAGPLDDFAKLLPTLLAQGLGGGGGATQVAGSWLRQLGADALVFPSARADLSVSIVNGVLQDWYGWNLLDYRGAPPPMVKDFVIMSPEWDKHPTTLHHDLVREPVDQSAKVVPVEFSHVRVTAVAAGIGAGSLAVEGIELARAFYHDIALWTYYTNTIGGSLGDSLLHLTFLAASDGNRGIYVDRVTGISRLFIAALHGVAEAKSELVKLPLIPHVANEDPGYAAVIQSLLALCD